MGFQYVNPTDEHEFPGIHGLRSQLTSWDWIYGHTPKFDIKRTFSCHVCGLESAVVTCTSVERGCITSASIEPSLCPPEQFNYVSMLCTATCSALNGVRFWPDSVAKIVEWSSKAVGTLQAAAIDEDVQRQWTKCIADCFDALVSGY